MKHSSKGWIVCVLISAVALVAACSTDVVAPRSSVASRTSTGPTVAETLLANKKVPNAAPPQEKVRRVTRTVRSPSPWRVSGSSQSRIRSSRTLYVADDLRPLATTVEPPSASEPMLATIAFTDSSGTPHRLIYYDDGTEKPPLEIVYLGFDDKGISIEYEWTATETGWVANTVHETVFEHDEPILYTTTTYSGGGGGGPGSVEPQTLNALSSKLGGAFSTAIGSLWSERVPASNTSIAIQEGSPCGVSAAAGYLETTMFLVSQMNIGRGNSAFPSSPPPSESSLNAAFRCTDALIRGAASYAQQQFQYLSTALTLTVVLGVWDLQDAIRTGGRMIRSIDLQPFNMDYCKQWIDYRTCINVQEKGMHPFPY